MAVRRNYLQGMICEIYCCAWDSMSVTSLKVDSSMFYKVSSSFKRFNLPAYFV